MKIAWYDLEDISYPDLEEARRKTCPHRLTPVQLEVLTQLRKTTWDGYVISKTARDQLCDAGLIIRRAGWQVVSEEGLAVLDTYGLLDDDRWGATTDKPNFMPMLTQQVWGRLCKEGLLRD